MKLLNFKEGSEVRLGIKGEKGIIDVKRAAAAHALEAPASMEQLIAAGEKGLEQLARLMSQDVQTIPEDQIEYAPCVTDPEKILCTGLNYAKHAAESKMEIPAAPVLFSKFKNALAAHKQTIILPKSAKQFDYEVELVIVMGKEATNVTKEEALSHVFGYTVGNDFSARDLQFVSGQWLLGKTCDCFAPIGPYLVTADEADVSCLDIRCEVNGVIRQSSNTSDMIFSCADIISYASQYMTLKPGDLIFTGTPSGVILGYSREEQQWLKAGDQLILTIEKIGSLRNTLE